MCLYLAFMVPQLSFGSHVLQSRLMDLLILCSALPSYPCTYSETPWLRSGRSSGCHVPLCSEFPPIPMRFRLIFLTFSLLKPFYKVSLFLRRRFDHRLLPVFVGVVFRMLLLIWSVLSTSITSLGLSHPFLFSPFVVLMPRSALTTF
jgi:hypothetical protein